MMMISARLRAKQPLFKFNDRVGRIIISCAASCILMPSLSMNGQADDTYKKTVQDGIVFEARSDVSEQAVMRAQYIVKQMLTNLPEIQEEMQRNNFKVALIARSQVLSDLPEYAYLKGKKTRDGRDFDQGTRGLGGKGVCSIGEENLLCLRKQKYWQEDILVHEFSHSIKAYLDKKLVDSIEKTYQNAVGNGLYRKEIYMMANSDEYWAEGTQAWFDVTNRSDVNDGFNTAEKLKTHDPELASILEQVYGSAHINHVPGCSY